MNTTRYYSFLFLCIFSTSVMSQNIYVHPLPQETNRVDVKYLRPFFAQDANVEMKTASGLYDIFMNMPVIKNYNLYINLPVIVRAYDPQTHGSGIGNVYLGLQSRPDSLDDIYTSTAFGIFFPTINSSISALNFLGIYASFQEPQKAMNDMLTPYVNYICVVGEHHRKYIGFEIGPQLYIPITSSAGTVDLYAHYGLSAGRAISHFVFTAEILGLAGLTSSYDSFGKRFDHSIALAVSYERSDFRPTVFYQAVFNDQTNQIINGIFGVNLSVNCGHKKYQ
jgi:hypothetical protein